MRIEHPDDYLGKKIVLHFTDGDTMTCKLIGYSFDYDDDGNEFSELDVETIPGGREIGLAEMEIDHIEILGDV